MDKWIIIKEWANMSTLKQLKTTLALIILFQSSTIIYFLNLMEKREVYYIKEINKTKNDKDNIINLIQKEKDECWQYHIKYIERNKVEFDELKKEFDKIQEHENNHINTATSSNRR